MGDTHPSLPTIRGVLFDCDGVLLDTEALYANAIDRVLRHFGSAYEEELRRKVMGRGEKPGAELIVNTTGIRVTPEEFLRRRDTLLREMFPQTMALPGAMRLTKHLARSGVSTAVVTSALRPCLELKIKDRHQEWFSSFRAIVTGEEVLNGKPHPDIYLLAAKRIGIPPEECLVFEDAPAGAEAGVRAGMTVIAVPEAGMNRDLYKGATAIIDCLESFDPTPYGLPSYTDQQQEEEE